ncbi:replication initiation protein [Flexibacterium corallicola]|uniref:replication initiation protein n=1 Tax=Flexibacterium corallicola TaxID=3037259 RepID=UPI00286F37D1|nr:replication initiation protein [Pseudovibrio sp. M1P-2-3]
MGETIQVASDREYDDTKTVLPTEYAQGLYVKNAPSAEALKLMHLMIASAGGRMADAVQHKMSLADIRAIKGMRNHDRKSLTLLFEELRACVLSIDDPEAMRYTIGGFLDTATFDYRHEIMGNTTVSWWFGGAFRELAAKSDHWAILDRQTLFALSSKYSILLFQHFASLQGLKHIHSKTFTVDELRALLGIPAGKITRFSTLNQRVIKPAIEEISQLSRFTLIATPKKIGRSVAAVEISWQVKQDAKALKKELNTHSTGRKARRNGTAETPAPSFPASHSISYSEPWKAIARTHGNGKDIDLIANDFRAWCKQQGIPLDKAGIEKIFEGFCKRAKI